MSDIYDDYGETVIKLKWGVCYVRELEDSVL
jgi:hypothetical protein